jgi:hypothetical protein
MEPYPKAVSLLLKSSSSSKSDVFPFSRARVFGRVFFCWGAFIHIKSKGAPVNAPGVGGPPPPPPPPAYFSIQDSPVADAAGGQP